MPKLGAVVIKAEICRADDLAYEWDQRTEKLEALKQKGPSLFYDMALHESTEHNGAAVVLRLWWRGGIARNDPNGPAGEVYTIHATRERND